MLAYRRLKTNPKSKTQNSNLAHFCGKDLRLYINVELTNHPLARDHKTHYPSTVLRNWCISICPESRIAILHD